MWVWLSSLLITIAGTLALAGFLKLAELTGLEALMR